jgi:hypothetical protein
LATTTTTTTEIKLIAKLIMGVKTVDQPGCSFKNLISFQDVCLKTKKMFCLFVFLDFIWKRQQLNYFRSKLMLQQCQSTMTSYEM